MTAFAQAKYLFWKEYRAQRGLWLGLVGFCLLFHLVMKLSFKFTQNGDLEFLFASGYLTILFYALASTAMLYSAEREQGTDVLIRTLPLNKWLFLGTKLAWVVLSSMVGLVLFGMSAILWTRSFSRVIEYQEPNGFFIYAFVFLLAMLTPLIASLLTKQVLSSIGASVVISFVMYWLLYIGGMYLLNQYVSHQHYALYFFRHYYHFALPVVLSLVVLDLNRRWFRESDFSWRWTWRLTRPQTLVVAIEEAPYSNAWRRLVWKEWRSARLWLICLSCLAFFFVNLTHLRNGPYVVEHRFIFFVVTICMTPLLAGFASCRTDQSRDEYRFYGNRGVSSHQILLTKHAVWMGSCLLILLLMSCCVWASSKSVDSQRPMGFAGSLHLIPISTGMLPSSMVARLSASWIPAVQFWACLSFFFYTLGHWCSISFKQHVMSLLAGIIVSIFAGGLIIFYYTLEVPLFILTIVPAICLLSLSFIWGDDWVSDRRERHNLMRPFKYGLLGLWTLITLLASWRVLEIPASMWLDQTGFNNLPARYVLICIILFVVIAGMLAVRDWIRSNFRTTVGQPIIRIRHDFRLAKIAIVFLVIHNVLLISVNAGYDYFLSLINLSTDQSISAIIAKQQREIPEEDSYHQIEKQISISVGYSPEEIQKQSQGKTSRVFMSWSTWGDVPGGQKRWHEQYRHLLVKFLAADESGVVHSTVMPRVPRLNEATLSLPLRFTPRNQNLIHLVRLEALRLEHEGNLEEAWRFHIALVRYARRFTENNLPNVREEALGWIEEVGINHDLWRWMARREQTPELLAKAAEDFSREMSELPAMDTTYQLQAEWSRQFYEMLSTTNLLAHGEIMASLPWERQRIRVLEQLQNQFALHLASQFVGRQILLVPHQLPDDYEKAYDFNASGLMISQYQLVLAKRKKNSDYDLLLIPQNMSLSTALGEGRYLSWRRDALPSKVNTTEILPAAPSREPNNYGLHHDLASQIASELVFWQQYRLTLASFAIYSYRAETGQFPAALYDIKETQTEELFAPILPSVAINTVEPEPDLLSWIAGILKHDANVRRYKADYNWYHASKWPHPEYNLGVTPDRKPPTPLIAPEPPVAHPSEEEMGMGIGFDSLDVLPATLNDPEPAQAQP